MSNQRFTSLTDNIEKRKAENEKARKEAKDSRKKKRIENPKGLYKDRMLRPSKNRV